MDVDGKVEQASHGAQDSSPCCHNRPPCRLCTPFVPPDCWRAPCCCGGAWRWAWQPPRRWRKPRAAAWCVRPQAWSCWWTQTPAHRPARERTAWTARCASLAARHPRHPWPRFFLQHFPKRWPPPQAPAHWPGAAQRRHRGAGHLCWPEGAADLVRQPRAVEGADTAPSVACARPPTPIPLLHPECCRAALG